MIKPLRAGVLSQIGWGLRAFSQDDLDGIHQVSLESLATGGIRVDDNERALEVFASHGCRVTRHGTYGIVKIPDYLVEECIRWTPGTPVLCGRLPQYDFTLEANRVTFATFGEMIQVIDPDTRRLRPTTRQDAADIARLCDRFDEIGVLQRPVAPLDTQARSHPVHNARILLEHSAKHVLLGPIDARNLDYTTRIAAAHVGGRRRLAERPIFTTIVCVSSPMRIEKNCADLIMASAEVEGGGVVASSVPLAGSLTPVTLAGTMVCANAEILAGLVLAQLVRRGTRVLYSCVGTMMDMRHMTAAYGAPEMGMLSAAMACMARYYRLPSHCSGLHTDSKALDPQIGYETAMNALTAALGGGNIINGLGSLELGLTFDYAKFMLDLECARLIRHIIQGVPVDDEHLAHNVIRTAGPGGEFLTSEHTFEHMRERSQTQLFDRTDRKVWEDKAARDLVENAYAAAKKALADHTPPPVADEVKREVEEIMREYLAEKAI